MTNWMHHPDDEPSPRFGNWADDFNTYADACRFYGCDTPADIAAEMAERDAEEAAEQMDAMMARGGPVFIPSGDIPF